MYVCAIFTSCDRVTNCSVLNKLTVLLEVTVSPNAKQMATNYCTGCTGQFKCNGTRAETRFGLSAKRTSLCKSAGGRQFSRLLAAEVCGISGSNAGYTMFRGSVKGTGYPLHSSVSPSLPLPCVTVCHHISTGVNRNCTCTYRVITCLNVSAMEVVM